MLDSPWQDAMVAARQRALNDQELAGEWPDHFQGYADAIRATGCHGSILDVGCGNGVGRVVLDRLQVPYTTYCGADISAHALAHAWERYPLGPWVQVSDTTAYGARGFDIVADTACLMCTEDWEWHLMQVCAAARQWVILHRVPVGMVTERFETHGHGSRFPATRFAYADVEREMNANGFASCTEAPERPGYTTLLYRRVRA